eukprot:CAMPEP_0181401298 /NCGR_PEP_ID=MMETSP1110-20121109/2575_1 /TAXON_ID=174948 /ORGANISM="Symbiodinium sp., Strain CCMP421" /LENGTH=104 /DNA_ID=CAMNT_0023523457 /DNA_START=159 /DNA_END=473 /DNA_ORIENTATION=-
MSERRSPAQKNCAESYGISDLCIITQQQAVELLECAWTAKRLGCWSVLRHLCEGSSRLSLQYGEVHHIQQRREHLFHLTVSLIRGSWALAGWRARKILDVGLVV